jgi:hypothetical protein
VSNITFHPAVREDIEYISANLREADFEEFVMATGRHPHGLLVKRALASAGTMVAKRDGRPAAVFGCVPQGDTGAPWLMGTPDIEGFDAARKLIETGRSLLDSWAQLYPGGLKHRAYAGNPVHIRYLVALGCQLSDPKPYGPLSGLFREFSHV